MIESRQPIDKPSSHWFTLSKLLALTALFVGVALVLEPSTIPDLEAVVAIGIATVVIELAAASTLLLVLRRAASDAAFDLFLQVNAICGQLAQQKRSKGGSGQARESVSRLSWAERNISASHVALWDTVDIFPKILLGSAGVLAVLATTIIIPYAFYTNLVTGLAFGATVVLFGFFFDLWFLQSPSKTLLDLSVLKQDFAKYLLENALEGRALTRSADYE